MRTEKPPKLSKQALLVLIVVLFIGAFLAGPILIVAIPALYERKDDAHISNDFVGFQDGPRTRGTMTIIFMCFSTLGACSYSLYHGDIPVEASTKEAEPTEKELVLKYKPLAHHMLVACLTFLMPEIILFRAVKENRKAKAVGPSMQQAWTGWKPKHSLFLIMNGFRDGEKLLTSDRLLLDFLHLREKDGLKVQWDQVNRRIELRDRSNWFMKGITVLQLLRLAVTTIARWYLSFPVTPLELTTCAHVVCAATTYIFWLHKPRNVQEPIDLNLFLDRDLAQQEKGENQFPYSQSPTLVSPMKHLDIIVDRKSFAGTTSDDYGEQAHNLYAYHFHCCI